MKRILLAVMLSIGVLGFAQSEKEIVQKYIIDKIKGYKPTDLVPYSKDGKKWALMDVKSRKILTDFVMRIPSTFNPEFMADINIGKWNYGMVINTNYDILPLVMACPIPEWFDVKKTDELGFQVDEQGRMTAYNKDYEYISNPILYKGEYYIIIIKKDKTNVLINQKGEEKEGFHFKEILDIYYKDRETGENVFYVEDLEGKRGLVTISGKKKLYGELLQEVYSRVIGYSAQKDNENIKKIKKSGVVDLMTQEWLIKPQEKYKIYDIIYTSSEKLKKYDETDRNKATVYFLATDKSGQHFVLDIKGNPILPKN
ncbi:MAG: hypothetical protein HG457_002010 [Flavobacteriaceae bacterium]|nr:hypothetical protein [Flavobacteriaceae bacterium]